MNRKRRVLRSLTKRRLASLIAGIVLIHSAPFVGEAGPEPVQPVRRVNHILIRVNDPNNLFSFFAETLHLPVAWPIATYQGFASGGVGAGNVGLEVIRFDDRTFSPPAGPTTALWSGFCLEPYSLAGSLKVLASRGVPYESPEVYSFTEADGSRTVAWTDVALPQFFSGDRGAFLCAYNPGMNIERMRVALQDLLRADNGGPLGIEAVKEVVCGTTDFDESAKRWQALLEPIPQRPPGVWQVGDGPAIHLVSSDDDRIQGIVVYVSSLARAKAFLEANHLIGSVSEDEIAIDPHKIQGLNIRLVERK